MVLNLGYGHSALLDKVTAIVVYGSSPLRALVKELSLQHKVIDATSGRKTRSLVCLSNGHAILCAVDAVTLQIRLMGGRVGIPAKIHPKKTKA